MGLTAIIPVAGEGRRLRPHTYSLPKPLLPVAGKPVLAHILDPLTEEVGVERVVLVLGHLGSMLSNWFQKRYPDCELVAVTQTEQLGLGHAIFTALDGAGLRSGPGLVILGDTIVRADFGALIASPGNGMGVKEVADPRRFGVAVTEGERITALEEKPEHPRSNLALVGLYSFRDLAPLHFHLERIIGSEQRTRGEFQLTDALQGMIAAGEHLSPFFIEGWHDVGTEETWLETNRTLLDGATPPAERSGVRFAGPVAVPDSALVTDSEIGPCVSLGESVEISGSRIENSIVGEGSVVTDCQLTDSLIGAGSVLRGLSGSFSMGADSVARPAGSVAKPQR